MNDGIVDPGDPGDPGTLNIDDGYTQESGGTLDIEFADSGSAPMAISLWWAM